MTTPPNPPDDQGNWPGGGYDPPPSGGGGYGEQPPGGGGYGDQPPGGGYGSTPGGGGYGDQPPGGGYGSAPPPGGGYGPPPGGGYGPPPGGGYGGQPPGGGYGAPPPGYGGPPASNNTPTVLGIIGIVCWFCCSPASIVLGFIGQSKAKQSGQSATLPMIAWIGGIVFLLLSIIYFIYAISANANSSLGY